MFERFDDPVAFRPDTEFRSAVQRRGSRLRRRRRAVVGTATAGVLAVAVASGAALLVDARDDAIDRVDVASPNSTDGATNVLLIGADDAVGGGGRADSIAVLRLSEGATRLLSIPRDLHDPAGGDRVNQALVAGGPQGLVDAVVRTTGLPIDHYLAVDVHGFGELVDAAGGLDLRITAPLRDERLGLALAPADCAAVDGATVLALARSRHLEQLQTDGTWVVDQTGDLGRVARQQVLLGAGLTQLDTDLASIERYSRLLADHAVLDSGLDLANLVALGRRLADGPVLQVDTLPVVPLALPSGAQVLALGRGAGDVLAVYGSVGPPPPPAAPGGPVGDGGGGGVAAIPFAPC